VRPVFKEKNLPTAVVMEACARTRRLSGLLAVTRRLDRARFLPAARRASRPRQPYLVCDNRRKSVCRASRPKIASRSRRRASTTSQVCIVALKTGDRA